MNFVFDLVEEGIQAKERTQGLSNLEINLGKYMHILPFVNHFIVYYLQ